MKITSYTKILILSILFGTFTISAQAQALKTPAPSPTQTLTQSFGISEIKIEYSRPSVKDRVVFGDLVPFGTMWRTGANASTKITFGDDVKIEDKEVKAGTYALYTIPNKENWEIILQKDLTTGGRTSDLKKEDEALRFTVKASTIASKVEMFTINIANITATTASIELTWDKTSVSFGVTTEIDSKIMKSIESALAADSRPYFQAANYYYENDKDIAKALEWANKAVEQNPKAFWVVMLKARIQLKSNDKKGAIKTAEQVIVLAKEAKNDGYVKMAEELITEAKKK